MDKFIELLVKYKFRIIAVSFGIIFAILIFTLGFFKTLLLFAIVAVAFIVGTVLDDGGPERIKEFFNKLISKK